MEKPPLADQVSNPDTGAITRSWATWISKLWIRADSVDGSGTTANRPTVGLFVGRQYFDTTLGKPVWLKSVRPSVWVDATGTAV